MMTPEHLMKENLTQTQEALLRAAFWQSHDAIPAWEYWRDSVDWDQHLDFDSFALLPYIFRNLQRLEVENPLLLKFKGITRQAWLSNQYWARQIEDLFADLFHARIEILFLPPTHEILVDRTAVINPQEPLYCAIRPEQAQPAIHCLLGSGWKSVKVHLPRWSLGGYVLGAHHLPWEHSRGQKLMLTWGQQYRLEQSMENIWSRARWEPLGKIAVRCLDETDALAFALRQPLTDHPLKQITGVLKLAISGKQFDWDRLQSHFGHRLLAAEWSAPIAFLQPFLAQWGAPANMHKWCADSAARNKKKSPPISLARRFHTDCKTFRLALGKKAGLIIALIQLPGYLMGKWRLRRLGALPKGFWRWLWLKL